MNRLVLSGILLLVAIVLAGCYTQIGYYEPRPSVRQTSYHHQEEREHRDRDEKMESEPEEQGEFGSDASGVEDEGYYGRRKPSYIDADRYYRSYHYDDYYPVYPYYYGGYHPLYPYYRYSYYPYHSYYGHYHYYGSYRYRPYRYSKSRSKIGDLNFGKRRSQNYRGVRSSQPSPRRSDRSLKSEEGKAPARSSPDSRRDRSRRSRRR